MTNIEDVHIPARKLSIRKKPRGTGMAFHPRGIVTLTDCVVSLWIGIMRAEHCAHCLRMVPGNMYKVRGNAARRIGIFWVGQLFADRAASTISCLISRVKRS